MQNHRACRQHSLPDEEALRAGELSEEEEEEDQEETGEDSGSQDGSGKEQQQSPKAVVRRAVLLLLAGTVLCAVFSDPVVDAVAAFSKVRCCESFRLKFLPELSEPSCGLCSQLCSHVCSFIETSLALLPCRYWLCQHSGEATK